MNPINAFVNSAVVQAFFTSALAIVLLKVVEQKSFVWVMQSGRIGGGGAQIASTMFVCVLAYRLGRDYLRLKNPPTASPQSPDYRAASGQRERIR
jgi:hypothetical protein